MDLFLSFFILVILLYLIDTVRVGAVSRFISPSLFIFLTIAARGGSKGVKNKSIRKLCGKPLMAYTIEQAKRWRRANRIVCSTDSEAIAEVARYYGAEVPFMRPLQLATDTSGKIDVLRHAWIESERIYHEKYEILADLDVTAPVRTIADIEGAYQMFLKFFSQSQHHTS